MMPERPQTRKVIVVTPLIALLLLFPSAALSAIDPSDSEGSLSLLPPEVRDQGAPIGPNGPGKDQTILVSRASGAAGDKGNNGSVAPSISADGRYVAFESVATNLHPDKTDGIRDVFVRDLHTGEVVLVSRASGPDGSKANLSAGFVGEAGPSISSDGRYVAFQSNATTLHPDKTDGGIWDVFVRDLRTYETHLVSRASGPGGEKADAPIIGSGTPAISADGRFVAFISVADNLHPDDTDGKRDVFVRDLQTHETHLVSRASGPDGANDDGVSNEPSISADGRFVAFLSNATNLHPEATDGLSNIYVRDLQTHETILVSRASGAAGNKNDAHATTPSISGNGRFVLFSSRSTNLHPDAPGDGIGQQYVRDLYTHDTILVTRASCSGGDPGNDHSWPSYASGISADGRFVTFYSQATNLHPDDTDPTLDVYVRDLQTHETILVSRASGAAGGKGDAGSRHPSISPDGHFVAFPSEATNLHPDDTDSSFDVFVRGVAGSAAPLRYDGPTCATRGTVVTLSAHLPAEDGSPASGRKIHFALGEFEAEATTDQDGVATVEMSVDQSYGAHDLVVRFNGDEDIDPIETSLVFRVLWEHEFADGNRVVRINTITTELQFEAPGDVSGVKTDPDMAEETLPDGETMISSEYSDENLTLVGRFFVERGALAAAVRTSSGAYVLAGPG